MSKKYKGNTIKRVALVALTIGLVGCKNNPSDVASISTTTTNTTTLNNNLPRVVATTSVLCDLTQQIAGNTINLTCLIPPDADPHLYQPNPEDRKAIEQAKLILYNGYNLEPGLLRIIKTTKNPAPKIAVGEVAVRQPQLRQNRRIADPHVWHNGKNAIAMVQVINSNLRKIAPKKATVYTNNTRKINRELTQLDAWIKSRISSIPSKQRRLVTTHDGMSYYAKAYSFSVAGAILGSSRQQTPTDAQVKTLAKGIQQAKITTIFPETTVNSNLVAAVARQAKVIVSQRKLYADGLGEPGSEADTYQKMMVANTRTIVEGLGGTYLIFEPKASR